MKVDKVFDAKGEIDKIVDFIKNYYHDNNLDGAILGISGGKDSAVVAGLLVKALGTQNVIGVTIPCHSIDNDKNDAKLVSDYYGFNLVNFDITDTYDCFKKELSNLGEFDDKQTSNSDINLKPRLRMATLYYLAALYSNIYNKTYLVVGTSNKCELYVGYFTKGGDSVHDISLIADFTVDEVIKIGECLNVPRKVLYKTPNDGLSNLSDEDKLGVKYKDIATYLENENSLDIEVSNKIKDLHEKSIHKYNIPTYKRKIKIGVYVGSFNPVHKGHKSVIDYIINNHYVDRVMVIPTENYWDKNDLIDIRHRINMLKFYENNQIIINESFNNLPYTYQILRELNNSENELYLIIGADNLLKFHLWKNIEEILNHKIIVLNRDNLLMDDYIKKFKNNDSFILLDQFKKVDVSSTNIRDLIAKKDIESLKVFLDEVVIEYIVRNNLYEKISE